MPSAGPRAGPARSLCPRGAVHHDRGAFTRQSPHGLWLLAASGLALVAASLTSCGVEESRNYEDDGALSGAITSVRLDDRAGGVTVGGVENGSHRLRRTIPFQGERPEGATHRIEGRVLILGGCGTRCSVEYAADVPAGLPVSGEVSGGAVRPARVGEVEVSTGSGGVELDGDTGTVPTRTTNGRIDGKGIGGDRIGARTTNGRIDLAPDTPAGIRAETADGAVTLTVPRAGHRAAADSVDGGRTVEVPHDPAGEFAPEVRTSNGDITVRNGWAPPGARLAVASALDDLHRRPAARRLLVRHGHVGPLSRCAPSAGMSGEGGGASRVCGDSPGVAARRGPKAGVHRGESSLPRTGCGADVAVEGDLPHRVPADSAQATAVPEGVQPGSLHHAGEAGRPAREAATAVCRRHPDEPPSPWSGEAEGTRWSAPGLAQFRTAWAFRALPRFDARELGEWLRLWITGRVPAILEPQKGVAEKLRRKPFEHSLLRSLGEMMKSARVFVVAFLCALTIGGVAGTAAADTGGAGTLASSSIAPADDSGWGCVPR